MKTEERIAIMQAYVDGKKIEQRYVFETLWNDVTTPSWNWDIFDYRIKPEPKYRPYANREECFSDVKKHGGWVKGKKSGTISLIVEVDTNYIETADRIFTLCELLNNFVWADDDAPCGILDK